MRPKISTSNGAGVKFAKKKNLKLILKVYGLLFYLADNTKIIMMGQKSAILLGEPHCSFNTHKR